MALESTGRCAHPGAMTAPEGRVGAGPSEQPETRGRNDSTNGDERAIAFGFSRREIIQGVLGFGGLVASGGVVAGIRAVRGGNNNPGTAPPEAKEPTPPAFEKDLQLRAMRLPDTLDAPTYKGVLANYSAALQYAMNHNDQDLIRRLIPGGAVGSLEPEHFLMRAEFINGYRSSNSYNPEAAYDPNDPRYFAWGFAIDLIELTKIHSRRPTDVRVNNFSARVNITMGELPPLVTMPPSEFVRIEESQTLETEIDFTRFAAFEHGGARELPDINGGTGRGWGWANAGRLYPIPRYMVPSRYEGAMPPLFDNTN